MPAPLTCPQGHRWDPSAPGADLCPRCGAPPVPPEGFTDSAVTADAHGGPSGLGSVTTLAEGLPPPPGDNLPFPAIEGYEVLGVLGRGGMGVVYHARQVQLKRPVALKVIRAAEAAGPESTRRFRQEAEAIARLHHPHIVQIYDVGEGNGLPYLALEYVEGTTLANCLGDKPLLPEKAAALAETLARAMHYAHERGVVHRDLKPANILLQRSEDRGQRTEVRGQKSEGGERSPGGAAKGGGPSDLWSLTPDPWPKITDFGLAKLLDEEMGHTRTGAVLGTPSYMAPEQAGGDARDVGPATDIYALGAILYETLTGRPPFRAATQMATLQQVLHQGPAPPSSVRPGVPRDLETICLKCLAKDPARRYSSALELAQDLARFRAGEPILGRREHLAGRLWRGLRRRPLTAGLFAAVVLLAVGIVATFSWMTVRASRLQALSQEFEQGLQADDWTAEHLGEMEGILARIERLAPERAAPARERLYRRVAQSVREAIRRPALSDEQAQSLRAAIELLAAEGRDPRAAGELRAELRRRRSEWEEAFHLRAPFEGPALAHVLDPARVKAGGRVLRPLHPAGANAPPVLHTRVACRGSARLEVVFDPAWGSATELGLTLHDNRAHACTVWAVDFAPEGTLLAAGGADGSIRLWEPSARRVRAVLQAHQGAVSSVRFVPGGRGLVSSAWDGTVTLWELGTGRARWTVKVPGCHPASLAVSADGKLLTVGDTSGAITLRDFATGEVKKTLRRPGAGDRRVCFFPDGKTLAAGSEDGTVALWDLVKAVPRHVFARHAAAVYCVAVAPDGKTVASGSSDGTVKLWDVAGGREKATLTGHRAAVAGVVFAPVGRALASAGSDGTVRLWDPDSGKERGSWQAHGGTAECLAFTADGRTLATGSGDRTVRLWDVASRGLVASLEARGYTFLLSAPPRPGEARPRTLGEAQKAGGPLRLRILRNGVLQAESTLSVGGRPDAGLTLLAGRKGDELLFQVNDEPPLRFRDVFHLGHGDDPGVFGVYCPGGVGLRALRAEVQPPSASPGELEKGDEAYARGQYREALRYYQGQARVLDAGTEAGQEARCKQALALLALRRESEAIPLLEQVAGSPGRRWPLVAGCHLWLLRLRHNRQAEADEVFDLISSRYRFEELALLIPEAFRERVLESYRRFETYYLVKANPNRLRNLERLIKVEELFRRSPLQSKWMYLVAALAAEEEDKALKAAEGLLAEPALTPRAQTALLRDYAGLLVRRGQAGKALDELNRRLGASKEVPPEYRPLLVYRAWAHTALKQWGRAERDLDTFLALSPEGQPLASQEAFLLGCLARGFLYERRGKSEEARRAWRRGLPRVRERAGQMALIVEYILLSLTDELTEPDARNMVTQSVKAFGADSEVLTFLGKGRLDIRFITSVLRQAWQHPRGREHARRIALGEASYAEYLGIQYPLTVAEAFRQGAFGGKPTKEQEELAWRTSYEMFVRYRKGTFSEFRCVQGILAWGGTTGFLGWRGLARSLDAQLRGPLAYLYGERYLRLSKREDAARLFRTALADAPAGSALARLAREGLKRVGVPKPGGK